MRRLITILLPVALGCSGSTSKEAEMLDRLKRLESLVAQQADELKALRAGPRTMPAQRVIEAQEIVLKDPNGLKRVMVGFDKVGKQERVPGVFVYDTNGTKRVMVVDTTLAAGVGVYSHKGQPGAAVFHRESETARAPLGSGDLFGARVAPDPYFPKGPPAN